MSNAHVSPTIMEHLAPFIALPKAHRVFAVKINLGGEMHEFNMLAPSSIAAIVQAFEMLAIDYDCPADGIAIDCRPASVQVDQCAECKSLAPTTSEQCRKCEEDTPAFTAAVDEFMKGGAA